MRHHQALVRSFAIGACVCVASACGGAKSVSSSGSESSSGSSSSSGSGGSASTASTSGAQGSSSSGGAGGAGGSAQATASSAASTGGSSTAATSSTSSSSSGSSSSSSSSGAASSSSSSSSSSAASSSSSSSSSSSAASSSSSSSSASSSSSSSSSGGTTAGLHVVGNKLVDNGKTVRLLGVDHSGTEYLCVQNQGIFDWGGSGVPTQAFVENIVSWHANTVRVPLNEDCWLGINGAPGAYSGNNYTSAIQDYVKLLRQNGLYVIVDLHWNDGGTGEAYSQQQMADADHAPAFWTSVANTFKGDQGILFDLYNEPHDISWGCWQNGGCQVNGWNVAGMNQLISAVRGTGATNVVMAGGLAYSSDLSSWLANKPTDATGNLAASFHTYNFTGCNSSSCWTTTIQSVAAEVPVITGELGENDCAHGYIDGYMSWADSAGVSYLGWAYNADFNCNNGPSLISDWSGTPTGFGAGYQAHLKIVNP